MPQIELDRTELGFLIRLCDLTITEYSAIQNGESTGEPDVNSMMERGLIIDDSGSKRINEQLRLVLHVVVDPEEVVDLNVNGNDVQDGFTICRRSDFLVQCNQKNNGDVLLAFPLESNCVVETVAYCFSGERKAPVSKETSFCCSAECSFALGVFCRKFGAKTFSLSDAQAAIVDSLNTPAEVLPLILGSGVELARELLEKPRKIFDLINDLVQLELVLPEGSNLRVDEDIVELLNGEVIAAVQLCRFNVANKTYRKLHAFRIGERILMMIPRTNNEGAFLQYWEEVDQEVLRKAAVSLLIDLTEPRSESTEQTPAGGG
jgi:hypothetical protein